MPQGEVRAQVDGPLQLDDGPVAPEADLVSVGSIIVRVHEGRIARLFVTCGGSWDADIQRQVREQTGELGAHLVGSQS